MLLDHRHPESLRRERGGRGYDRRPVALQTSVQSLILQGRQPLQVRILAVCESPQRQSHEGGLFPLHAEVGQPAVSGRHPLDV